MPQSSMRRRTIVRGRLAAAGQVPPDVTAGHAADVLCLLTGSWPFDELYSGPGLDADAFADVLLEVARSTLLVPASGSAVGASGSRANRWNAPT